MDVSVNVSFRELVRFHGLADSFKSDIAKECNELKDALAKLKSNSSTEEIEQIEQCVKQIEDILSNSEIDLQNLVRKISEYERFVVRLKMASGGLSFGNNTNKENSFRSSVPNLNHTNQSYTNATINGQAMFVYDHPQSLGSQLKSEQGKNDLNKLGTCSLVSCTNIMKIGGVSESENSIVKNATQWGLCSRSGGTNASFSQLSEILSRYGIETERSSTLTPEGLAKVVENGHGTIISVDSSILWNEPSMKIFPSVDHAITVTSVARNPSSGKIEGFFVCDSGRCMSSDASRFVDINTMKRAHFYARNHGAIYTKNVIW